MVQFQEKVLPSGNQQTGKRLRMYGPGIKEYEEALDIESMEFRKNVNVVVRSDPSGVPTNGIPANLGSVASSRLRVPSKAEKEFQKGKDAGDRKDWPEATKHFQEAIAVYADYDLAYNGLGQALASSGDVKGARSAFEKAIHLNGNFPAPYPNLANLSLIEHKFYSMD